MLTVTKEIEFDAAHYLPEYEGACQNLHGHRWKIAVTVAPNKSYSCYKGMVMDFGDLKNLLNVIIMDKFDHKLINDVIEIPLAENMVLYIVKQLQNVLKKSLIKVKLWETPSSYCTWRKDCKC